MMPFGSPAVGDPNHRPSVLLWTFKYLRYSLVPMLILMVGYTCFGLWVLSLPLGLPQIVPTGG